MDTILHAQALELFKLPRKLGMTAAGEEITTNVGRFGPYVKYGSKYVSLKTDDPYEISPERALEVIREKEIADANRLILDFPDAGIQVLNGRFGPYITDKQRNAKIPKDKEPKSLTLEECQSMLAAAPVRTFGKWGRTPKKGLGAKAKNGKGAPKATATTAPPEPVTTAKKRSRPTGTGQKLAARASKTAANKKAPLQSAVQPAASRPAAKPKKGSAKKKT
jgi:DNA topoisomerase-1